MPVRSLTSRVVKWPDSRQVMAAVTRWAEEQAPRRDDLEAVGIIGSYARGNWGVGSDVDIVVVVEHSDLPFMTRAREWIVQDLPVPADLLIYTRAEWEAMLHSSRRGTAAHQEIRWVYRSA